MKKTMVFLFSSLIYLTNLAHSQKPTTQYAFKEIDLKNDAQEFGKTIRSLVTNNFEEHEHVRSSIAKVEGETYFWFHAFLNSDRDLLKLIFLFIKQTADALIDWHISYQEQTSYYLPTLYRFNQCSMFFIDQVIYMKVYEWIYSDFEDRTKLYFFSVNPDSVRNLGFIDLRDMDNPSD